MEEYTVEEKTAFDVLNMDEEGILSLAKYVIDDMKISDEDVYNDVFMKIVNWIVTAQIQASLLSLLAKGAIAITEFGDEPVFSTKAYTSVMNQISDILEENINTKGDL